MFLKPDPQGYHRNRALEINTCDAMAGRGFEPPSSVDDRVSSEWNGATLSTRIQQCEGK